MRRILAALLLAAAALLLAGVGPAAAIDLNPFDGDCEAKVSLGTPTSGAANGIDGGPKDPRTGEGATLYEKYGYGGLTWPTFDCGVTDMGAVTDPGGSAAGTLGNIMLSGAAVVVAVSAAVIRFAFAPDTLDVFDPIMELSAHALGDGIFRTLFWVTLAATGLLILHRAVKGRMADNARNAGWVGMIGLVGLAATVWPLVVAPVIDQFVTSSIGAVNTELAKAQGNTALTASDGLTANLHRSMLYETWCSGMVGKAGGETADEFCPRLWEASTVSRAELEAIKNAEDPQEAGETLAKEKADDFTAAVEDLKDADATAYQYLVGEHNSDRIMYAALAWFGIACAMLFLVTSAVLLIYALIVVRIGIMAAPAVAVVGGFPPMRRHMIGLFDYVMGAVFTALLFGAMSAVFVALMGAFLSPENPVHPLLSMVLMLATTLAAWKFTKPFRRVKDLSSVKNRLTRGDRGFDSSEGFTDKDGKPESPDAGGGIFTPSHSPKAYASATPAEAAGPSMFKAAAAGAVQGAASSVVIGAMTGGTATVGAAAAGAARGATAGGLGAATAAPGLPAGGAQETRAHASPSARALPASPAEANNDRPRVFKPGEHTPAEGTRYVEPTTTSQGERVYDLYTPESKEQAV